MLLQQTKLRKEDGQNGFTEFQSLELTFFAIYWAKGKMLWAEVFKFIHAAQVMSQQTWQATRALCPLKKESEHQYFWLNFHLRSTTSSRVNFSKRKNFHQLSKKFNDKSNDWDMIYLFLSKVHKMSYWTKVKHCPRANKYFIKWIPKSFTIWTRQL